MDLKVIIIDENKAYREVLSKNLRNIGGYQVLAELETENQIEDILEKHKPDITFMEIKSKGPEAAEQARTLLSKHPNQKLIGMSMHKDNQTISEFLRAGASGYLSKMSNNFKVLQRIKEEDSRYYFSESVEELMKTNSHEMKLNILVVDDFAANTVVIRSSLLMTGKYNVQSAKSVQEALKVVAREDKFDAFLLDFNMPDGDGADLITELRKMDKYRKTPMLILSSETNEDKKAKAKFAGATGWIKKPFKIDKFMNILGIVTK